MRHKELFSNQNGYGTVEMLIYTGLVIFLCFGAIDYGLTQDRIERVNQYKEYYLDRVRMEGWLSVEDEAVLVNGLSTMGYKDITIDAPLESLGHPRILRNTEDPASSEVWLEISCKLDPSPLVFGEAIGAPPEADFIINKEGRASSERVEP